MREICLSDGEFARFQRFIHQAAGIQLAAGKKVLVSNRLSPRLRARSMPSFSEYFRLISDAAEAQEMQTAIDLLTTNETYFFREPKHFEFLRGTLMRRANAARPFRVWSAASSSGEEAYSVAMLLDDCLGHQPWEIFASDLSTRMLEQARRGQYPLARTTNIPSEYLRSYCLKGIGPEDGTLLVIPELRSRITFAQVNLTQPLPQNGSFDVILLRNVMIYFDLDTKRAVVSRLVERLQPGGHFLVGHSETLHGIDDTLQAVAPAIFCKPAAR